jgi:hypothetical protein
VPIHVQPVVHHAQEHDHACGAVGKNAVNKQRIGDEQTRHGASFPFASRLVIGVSYYASEQQSVLRVSSVAVSEPSVQVQLLAEFGHRHDARLAILTDQMCGST